MSAVALIGPVAAIIVFFLVTELLLAILPLLLVITLVPPHERPDLAAVLAAADKSPRWRFWAELRTAVAARRRAQAGRYSTSGRPGPP
ncbi:hypothetical protein [Actinoplanes sp. NPDC020271]|uniref:hypothetical protein n=1 Tax=Actinoplanes sp. NPDC020271 TaxID=3363896 RepID=UPI003790D94F